jgi:16S rRNA (cytidine1402-2'-O)-methyltransferase
MATGTLYLVPTGLGGEVVPLLPPATLAVILRTERFIAENPKTGRAFLKAVGYPKPLQTLTIDTLDEHTPDNALESLLAPLLAGADCALLSEAGCPAVADPGADLVRKAHAAGIRVAPLVGPSALLLAVMASGLNGQRFAFHGYLPIEREARARRLCALEADSAGHGVAQLFIEAPYRNGAMFDAIVASCSADTLLCVAVDLTLESESVRTLTIAQWKGQKPELDRRPAVFLIYREAASRARGGGRGAKPQNR